MRHLLNKPWLFALLVMAFPIATAVGSLLSWPCPFSVENGGLWALGGLLAVPVVALFNHRAGYRPALRVPRQWALLIFSAAMVGAVDLSAFAAPWQLPLAIFMMMGCACLLRGLFGVLSHLFWALFFYCEFAQRCGYTEYGSRINSLVLAETLESSQEEFFSYCTPVNGTLMVVTFLLGCAAAWVLARLLRGSQRVELLNTGVLWVSVSGLLGACLPPADRTEDYYWPATEVKALAGALTEALTLNQVTIVQAESLRSPADRPTSIATLKGKEGVVLVLHVGESVRADRMSLNGYERDTTPWLRQQKNIVNFSDFISAACDTCQVELVLLTNGRRAITDGDTSTQPTTGSVLDLFAANGFEVYSFFGRRSAQQLKYDRVVRVLSRVSRERYNAPGSPWTSVPQMREVLAEHPQQNLVLFVNNEGSHTPFEHYDRDHTPFTPATTSFHNPSAHAEEVNNAYDSTIHYTDEFVHRVAEALAGRPWVYVYVSDHGEYLGHDGIWGRAGLGKDKSFYFTTTGSRVGAFVLWSPEFEQLSPHFAQALRGLTQHADLCAGDEHLFHTLLGLFGISSPYYEPSLDLSSEAVQPYSGPKPPKK